MLPLDVACASIGHNHRGKKGQACVNVIYAALFRRMITGDASLSFTKNRNALVVIERVFTMEMGL